MTSAKAPVTMPVSNDHWCDEKHDKRFRDQLLPMAYAAQQASAPNAQRKPRPGVRYSHCHRRRETLES